MKKVLIGITSKNRAGILPKAIRSAQLQEYENKEVAVFDDNSTDGTTKLQVQFPTIKWYFSNENKGYLFGRNMFLQTTDADYYCSLDDDSWFLDNSHLQAAINFMNENSKVAVLAFKILSRDNSRHLIDNKISETNNFIGCGHMLRVRAVNEVGNYAINPGFYGGEEKDLCIRLIDKNYSIIRYPSIEIWHDKSMVSRNISKQHRSGVCNDFVFMWRRTPAIYLIPSFALKFYVHISFPFRYKNMSLFVPLLFGIFDFAKVLFSGTLKREPVSKKTLKKYLSFNKTLITFSFMLLFN